MSDNNAALEKKFISAVVYLHNDVKRIGDFTKKLTGFLSSSFTDYEIIFADDASSDGSVAAIRALCATDGNDLRAVSIVQLGHFQGQESAMNAGRDLAIGDFVYEFDDMLVDYDPALMLEVYKKALEGYDIVSAGCENAVSASSGMFYYFYNNLSSSEKDISSETFRILSRRAINKVKTIDQYIPYRKAIYMNCGLDSTVIKYRSDDPGVRKRMMKSRHERSALAVDSLIYFTNAMERLSLWICILFAIVAVAVGVDIIYETAAFTHPVEGWRSTMGFLSIGFFGVFLVLAIILRYLSVLVNLTFKRSRYLIAGIDKVTSE